MLSEAGMEVLMEQHSQLFCTCSQNLCRIKQVFFMFLCFIGEIVLCFVLATCSSQINRFLSCPMDMVCRVDQVIEATILSHVGGGLRRPSTRSHPTTMTN